MPNAAPKPCRFLGCGKLVADGTYCPDHKRERNANRFADTHRGSRHERGYGTAWDKKRVRILKRDNGLCQPCLKSGVVTVARQVDHIVSKAIAAAAGWSDDQIESDDNLQSICTECHKLKTAREASHGRGASKV